MKKLIALLLALVMIMSFAACAGGNAEPTEPEITTTEPQTTEPAVETSGNMTSFSLTYGEDYNNIKSLSISTDDEGGAYVQYVNGIRKIGSVELSAMDTVEAAFLASGLLELNGQDDYQEGEASASMYVTFADETMYMVNYGGVIPEAFLNGFNAMVSCFETVTADIPEYVPTIMVGEGIAEGDKATLDALLENVDLGNPENFVMGNIVKDEYFAVTAGLTSDEGIASGATFGSMRMPPVFAVNLVTLDSADPAAVAADFVANMDWTKWVCAQPGNAMVATKDNQVICMVGDGDVYNQLKSAMETNGWSIMSSMENPNM